MNSECVRTNTEGMCMDTEDICMVSKIRMPASASLEKK